jgi:hypothetical protein
MPGILQLIGVTKTPQRIQSFMVTNDTFMLVNPDIVNNIFIGNDPGTQLIAVPALGSVTLNAKDHDLWVSTNGGNFTVNAYLMPGGSNWVPSPAQVAAQINALGLAKETTQLTGNTNIAQVNTTLGTPPQKSDVNQVNTTLGVPSQTADVTGLTTNGIPPLRGTVNLGNATAQAMTANTTATLLNAVSVTRPSFECVLQFSYPGAATVPFGALLLKWTDSNTGLTVGQKNYEIIGGNNVFATCYLSGPCRGNQITLQFRPQDPAQAATLTWAFNQTSHIYTIDRLLQPSYVAVNGFTNPAGDPSKGLLASVTAAIGPNASITRLLAASNAKIKIMLDNTVQANAAAVQINTPSSITALYSEAGAPTSLFKTTAAIGGQGGGEWQLPNGATTLQIFNTNITNTITPNVTITLMEY